MSIDDHSWYTFDVMRARFLLLLIGFLGCGEEAEVEKSVADLLVEAGPAMFVLPPINGRCGTFQPGWAPASDPDDCDTLDGECYDVFRDDFCTSVWMYVWTEEDGRLFHEWYNYFLDIGEVDPTRDLPPHMEAILAQSRDSALHCRFRWSVEVEDVEGFSATDVQRFTPTLEEVSFFCSAEYSPGGWVVGEDFSHYMFRSTNPDVLLLLDDPPFATHEGNDRLFSGFIGIEETGGWSPFTTEGLNGSTFYYKACTPVPSDDGQGIGFCPRDEQCRYFSAGAGRRRCGWEDVRALPANPDLIDPLWEARYPSLYDEVFGTDDSG